MFYENGSGVAQDYGEAMRWFHKVADQGDAFAQNKIGVLYYNGWGVARDYGEAMRWFRMAADHGDARAQNNIGWLYANGEGVPRDLAQASQKAAGNGNELPKNGLPQIRRPHNGAASGPPLMAASNSPSETPA